MNDVYEFMVHHESYRLLNGFDYESMEAPKANEAPDTTILVAPPNIELKEPAKAKAVTMMVQENEQEIECEKEKNVTITLIFY